MSEAEAKSTRESTDYLKTIHALMSVSSSHLEIEKTGDVGAKLDEALAERDCLNSMMLEPKNPAFWNAFALVYIMNGDYDAAEDAIERSLEIDTGVACTWRIWGDLFLGLGRSGEAERAYRMSLELKPWSTYTIHQLAVLYMRRGAFPEAVELISRLLLMIPDNQEIWDSLTHCINNSP